MFCELCFLAYLNHNWPDIKKYLIYISDKLCSKSDQKHTHNNSEKIAFSQTARLCDFVMYEKNDIVTQVLSTYLDHGPNLSDPYCIYQKYPTCISDKLYSLSRTKKKHAQNKHTFCEPRFLSLFRP